MAKHGSLKNQVKNVMKQVNSIGESKRDAKNIAKDIEKKTGVKQEIGIHNYDYYRACQHEAVKLVEHAKKEYGVKSIWELRPEHKDSYMETLRNREGGEASNGYKINVESRLRKFQEAMRRLSEKNGKEPTVFIEERTVKSTQREKPKDRSYTDEELDRIYEKMSPEVRKMAELSRATGLRNREAANMRVEHIRPNEEHGMVIEWRTKKEAKGITKGGRPRMIPVPHDFQKQLQEMMAGKAPGDRLSNVSAKTLRNGFAKAAKKAGLPSKGWHSLRHSYAREKFREILGNRFEDAQPILKHMKENVDAGRSLDHDIPSEGKDRELFREILAAADLVHELLGHGKGRTDLLRVYIL